MPAGFAKAKMRCPACGVYVDVPQSAREEAARAEPEPNTRARVATLDAAPGADATALAGQVASSPVPLDTPLAPLLDGTEDDDGKPYAVPADPEEERRKWEAAQPKKRKPLPPLEQSWEVGWPLGRRLQVFAGMQVLNLGSSLMILSDPIAVFTTVVGMAALQAFLLGTFDRVNLSRNAKGRVSLGKTWRVGFYPLSTTDVPWREHESVGIGKLHDPKFEDWYILLVLAAPPLLAALGTALSVATGGFSIGRLLALPFLAAPAAAWWWFVIRPERIQVFLCKDHGFPETMLYRGTDEHEAQAVATRIAEVTTLPLKDADAPRL